MIELAGGLRNTDPGIIKFHTGTDVTANNPEGDLDKFNKRRAEFLIYK